MKSRLYIVFLYLFLSVNLSAQNSSISKEEDEMHRAETLFQNKDYDSALKVFLHIADNSSATDKELRVKALMNVILCHEKLGSCKQGMDIAESLLKSDLSEDHKQKLSQLYTDIGLLYGERILNEDDSNVLQARGVLEKVKPYAVGKVLDKINICLQKTYILESSDCLKRLQHEKADSLLDIASTLSNDEKMHMNILSFRASIDEIQGDYDNMLANYLEIERLAAKLKDNDLLYSSLMGERSVYKMQNNMEDYTRVGVKLDSLMSESGNSKILGEYYDFIGNEFLELGNYSIAEYYFKRLGNLIENEKHISTVFTLKIKFYSNMRDVKRKENDYKSAIEYNRRLTELNKKIFTKDSYLYYVPYMVETLLYAENGDSVNFKHTCDTLLNAADVVQDAFNKSLIYHFCGSGYSKFNNSRMALIYYHKADSILEEKYDEKHDMRMTLLHSRARELANIGRIDEACRYYKHYMQLTAEIYGKDSQQYSDAVYYYANVERMNNNWAYSARLYRKSIAIMNDILRKQLRYVTSTDRISYINSFSKRMWKMSSFALDYSAFDTEFVKDCYNTILVLKSLLFESDRSMYNTLQAKGSPEDVEDFVKLSNLRNWQKTLYKDYDKNKEEIDNNYIRMRELDNKLTEKSQVYSDYTSFLNFKYEDVCRQLGRRDVLFDFFDYIEDGVHKYVAYVVKKKNPNPIIIDMFSEDQLDSLLKGSSVDAFYNESYSEEACRLLWKRIEKYAEKGARVYYVPSGVMYQLSLESLPLADGSILGEHYRFVRVSSARTIADSRKCLEGDKKAVLYGGLYYDVDISEMKKQSSIYDHNKLYLMRGIPHDNNGFAYLPETLKETEDISSILKSEGYDVKLYSKEEGNEESFVDMHNKSPQIIHMATHGFYFTPEEAKSNVMLKGSTDAMYLSGLVLSGGNAVWQGRELPQGVMDGIISAGNISCLDLSNTGLVVLSACQSGAGMVTRQGLFGLQRAFKKAGVQTIVMTLWDVSDVVTHEFMVEFYKNLFSARGGKSNKIKAFIKAKNYIRKKYPEPFYWAGFIMVD